MAAHGTDEHGLLIWPAAERNKQPITEVLQRELPARGVLLEIASGTGQHAAHFAGALSGWTIQPSDCDAENLETLRRRVALLGNPRLLAPIELDVTAPPAELDVTAPSGEVTAAPGNVTAKPRPLEPSAIYCANMVHIAPWAACIGLFRLARRWLPAGGPLLTYGPYLVHGKHTAESNLRFDESLRERNPEWGVRDVDAMTDVARAEGLELVRTHAMPANNLFLVWQRG